MMPKVFQCPSNAESLGHTPYKLVDDKGTPFEQGQVLDFGDVLDGCSNTIGIIEDSQNPVVWTKPEGLTLEQAVEALAPKDPSKLSHVNRTSIYKTVFLGSVISLMDGSPEFVRPTVDPEMIKGACLCNDGQIFDWEDAGDSVQVDHWDKLSVTGLYIILLILPAFGFQRKARWHGVSSTRFSP